MSADTVKHGDFTGLAKDYAQYRPAYSETVLSAILGLVGKTPGEIDAADVGAGTGIWTRMLARRGLRSVTAVEPNADMRQHGAADPDNGAISWRAGSAEHTSLADGSADLVSMASSFHWADFDVATAEFHRVLRPGGHFIALWNPRLIEANPLLVRIEEHLRALAPDLKRVSSGRSGIAATLTERLWTCPRFDDVVYLEGRHTVDLSVAHYLGAWRSVNDIQVQLGPQRFADFLDFVADLLKRETAVTTTYLTRAWVARRA
ncbi:class I SAM-dependent methyltransferase [Azospirillum isscasi]|uniref:Class I SAM-dependent methyltransferase n=1 Tax=Azospirillum isscasi TaxID=3053926 RepID=A0ABU0WJ41_9PROT|nr:class I SAM-dependent methyltransferase [Azospirillum isscasi]MDQ2104241.1 class I SAM-dependent methyltransferase [Azospirillum isscasi]